MSRSWKLTWTNDLFKKRNALKLKCLVLSIDTTRAMSKFLLVRIILCVSINNKRSYDNMVRVRLYRQILENKRPCFLMYPVKMTGYDMNNKLFFPVNHLLHGICMIWITGEHNSIVWQVIYEPSIRFYQKKTTEKKIYPFLF